MLNGGASENVLIAEHLVLMVLRKGMLLREGLPIYMTGKFMKPCILFLSVLQLMTSVYVHEPISSSRLNFESCLYDPLTDQTDTCVSKQGGQVGTLAGDTMPFPT